MIRKGLKPLGKTIGETYRGWQIPNNQHIHKCKFCNSDKIIKYGKKRDKQRYRCKKCKSVFYFTIFEKNKFNPVIVHHILNSFFMKVSYRKIRKELKDIYNFDVTHKTIGLWIKQWRFILDDIGLKITSHNDYRYVDFDDIIKLCDKYREDYNNSTKKRGGGNKGGRPSLLLKIIERRKNEILLAD